MLNFVHTLGATKSDSRGKVELLAPSALCAGTTEGTCAETPCISSYYKNSIPSEGRIVHSVTKFAAMRFSHLGTLGDDGGFIHNGACFGGFDSRFSRALPARRAGSQ
jgi:hypothetical protein